MFGLVEKIENALQEISGQEKNLRVAVTQTSTMV